MVFHGFLGLQVWHRQTSGYGDILNFLCIDTVYLISRNWKIQSAERCHEILCTSGPGALCRWWIYNSFTVCYFLWWWGCGSPATITNDLEAFCSLFACFYFDFCTSATSIGCFLSYFFPVLKKFPWLTDASPENYFLFLLCLRVLYIIKVSTDFLSTWFFNIMN